MSIQPLERRRLASAPMATSRLRVANDTEMNAPIDMMKTITPNWPNSFSTFSVSTTPASFSSPYVPFTGASTSCCTPSPNVSGRSISWYVPGIGAPSTSTRYSPAGMNSAATHTRTITTTSIVTAVGELEGPLRRGNGEVVDDDRPTAVDVPGLGHVDPRRWRCLRSPRRRLET